MRIILKLCIIALYGLAFTQTANAQKQFSVKSPSGKLEISILVNKENIEYYVTHDKDILVDKSPISMTFTDREPFGINPKLSKTQTKSYSGVIHPPLYRKSEIKDNYNELVLQFKGDYNILFRAYDDGVAYRFASTSKKPFTVEWEQVTFNFPADYKVFAAYAKGRQNDGVTDNFYSAFQNTYVHIPLSEWDKDKIAFAPLLVECVNNKKVCITEADLLNYPGMYLQNKKGGTTLEPVFAPYPKVIKQEVRALKGVVKQREPYIAKCEGATNFPWRVMAVSENDSELVDNDIVYKLATPAQFNDFSWIKPGKVAWDWWNDWNIYNVDFRAGINTETYKYYIDFASEYGLEYVILDEGWSVTGKADLFAVVPEIDLKEIIRYAETKNVGIILWAGYYAFAKDMDGICKHYSEMGVKGFKLDFMDRDDQLMVDFHHRAAQATAKYKLLMDFHGTYKPTGLQRTYPNVVNFEGVFGLEELKWAKPDTDIVTYDVTMPFVRMVAGPLDYTQGAMDNRTKENFMAIYKEPMSQGTRCRQLATYIIFDSPVNMMCDAPSNYMREEECTRFIADIPTVWDKTIPLNGKVSEYVSIARQKGDIWYVGSLTNWDARTLELDLSFLGNGSYKAEIFKDGINADRVGKDYKREIINIPANRKLPVSMAPGGGFIMKIYKE